MPVLRPRAGAVERRPRSGSAGDRAERTASDGPSRRATAEVLAATARSITWIPFAMGAVASTALVAWNHGHTAESPLFIVVVLLSSPLGFALDDPATVTLAASPTSLLRRRLFRLALVVPAAAAIWGLLLWSAYTHGPEEASGLTLVFTGLVALTLGAAGVATRRSSRSAGGTVAAIAVLVLLFLSSAFPPRWRPLPMGDIPGGWPQVSIRWAAAAVIGTLAFLVSSRDPAARGTPRGMRRRPMGSSPEDVRRL